MKTRTCFSPFLPLLLLGASIVDGIGASSPPSLVAREPATETTASPPLLSSLTADDGQGGHAGDITLNFADDGTANAINNVLDSLTQYCVPHSGRRLVRRDPPGAFEVDCIVDQAYDIIDNLGSGGALANLGQAILALDPSFVIPSFDDEYAQQAFSSFLVAGVDMLPAILPNIQQNVILPGLFVVITVPYLHWYRGDLARSTRMSSNLFKHDSAFQMDCPSAPAVLPRCNNAQFCAGQDGICTAGIFKSCTCTASTCPEDYELTTCAECGGSDSYGKCLSGDNAGCDCFSSGIQQGQPFYESFISEQRAIFATLTTVSPTTRTAQSTSSVHFSDGNVCSLITTTYTSPTPTTVSVATGIPYYSCTCTDGQGHAASVAVSGSSTSAYCPSLGQANGVTVTRVLILIYEVPPVTGRPEYIFYDQSVYDDPENHDQDCGNKVGDYAFAEFADPTFAPGDVSNIVYTTTSGGKAVTSTGRPATGWSRYAPGTIVFKSTLAGGYSCEYIENNVGHPIMSCRGGTTFNCGTVDPGIATKIVKTSSCSTFQSVLNVVATCAY